MLRPGKVGPIRPGGAERQPREGGLLEESPAWRGVEMLAQAHAEAWEMELARSAGAAWRMERTAGS
jgi:hypothetical protein